MESKKAQNLPLTTILLVIIGVIVIGFLIYWFVAGGGQLGDWITNLFGKPNIGQMTSTCQVACTTAEYEYCVRPRTVRWNDAEDNLVEIKTTCDGLAKGTAKDNLKTKDTDSVTPPTVDFGCDLTCPAESAETVEPKLET